MKSFTLQLSIVILGVITAFGADGVKYSKEYLKSPSLLESCFVIELRDGSVREKIDSLNIDVDLSLIPEDFDGAFLFWEPASDFHIVGYTTEKYYEVYLADIVK